jgi:hypothetical protein
MVLGRAGLVRSLNPFMAAIVGKGRHFVAVWYEKPLPNSSRGSCKWVMMAR